MNVMFEKMKVTAVENYTARSCFRDEMNIII